MAVQQPATGSKKRLHKRGYKSYRIKYGPRDAAHQAYARRLSERGLFIDSNFAVYPAGTPLVIQLEINGVVYCANGMVRNARKSDVRMIRIFKPGMGVEFTHISPELRSVLSAGL